MLRLLGGLLILFCLLCVFGFIVGWIDVSNHSLNINSDKISTDWHNFVNGVKGIFQ